MCTFSGLYMMFFMLVGFGVLVCLVILVNFFTVLPRLEKISNLLDNGRLNISSFRYWQAWGEYKGRVISAEYSLGETRLDRNGFYIEPKCDLPREKLFIIDLHHPTKHTYLVRGRIRYDFIVGDFTFSKKGLTAVFEELTQAAEIVENGLPYYDETGFHGPLIVKFITRNFLTILALFGIFIMFVMFVAPFNVFNENIRLGIAITGLIMCYVAIFLRGMGLR